MDLPAALAEVRRRVFKDDVLALPRLEAALREEATGDSLVPTPFFVRTMLGMGHNLLTPRAVEALVTEFTRSFGDEQFVAFLGVVEALRPPLMGLRLAVVDDAWGRLSQEGTVDVSVGDLGKHMRGSESTRIVAFLSAGTVTRDDFLRYYQTVSAVTDLDDDFSSIVRGGQRQTEQEKALSALAVLEKSSGSGGLAGASMMTGLHGFGVPQPSAQAKDMSKLKCTDYLMHLLKDHGMTMRGFISIEGYRRYNELPPHAHWLKRQPVDEEGTNPVLVRQARGYAVVLVRKRWLVQPWNDGDKLPSPDHTGKGFGLDYRLQRLIDPAKDLLVKAVVKGHPMKEDEGVRHAMRAWAAIVEQQLGPVLKDHDYARLYEKVFLVLSNSSDKRRARAAAALDWPMDCEGKTTINLLQVGQIMFAIADMWVDSCQPSHYFHFLSELYRKTWGQPMPAVGSQLSLMRDPTPGPGTHEVSSWYKYKGDSKHPNAPDFSRAPGREELSSLSGGGSSSVTTPGPGEYDSLGSLAATSSEVGGFFSDVTKRHKQTVVGPGRWVRDAFFLNAAAAASNTPFIPYVVMEKPGPPCRKLEQWNALQLVQEDPTWSRYCIERGARVALQTEHAKVRREWERQLEAEEELRAAQQQVVDDRFRLLEGYMGEEFAQDSDAVHLAARLELQENWQRLSQAFYQSTVPVSAPEVVETPPPSRAKLRPMSAAVALTPPTRASASGSQPRPASAVVPPSSDRRYRPAHGMPESRPPRSGGVGPELSAISSVSSLESPSQWPTAGRIVPRSAPRQRQTPKKTPPRPASAFDLPYRSTPASASGRKRLCPISSKEASARALQAHSTRARIKQQCADAFDAAEDLTQSSTTAVSRLASRQLAGLVPTKEKIPCPAVNPPDLMVDRMVLEQLLLSRKAVVGRSSAASASSASSRSASVPQSSARPSWRERARAGR